MPSAENMRRISNAAPPTPTPADASNGGVAVPTRQATLALAAATTTVINNIWDHTYNLAADNATPAPQHGLPAAATPTQHADENEERASEPYAVFRDHSAPQGPAANAYSNDGAAANVHGSADAARRHTAKAKRPSQNSGGGGGDGVLAHHTDAAVFTIPLQHTAFSTTDDADADATEVRKPHASSADMLKVRARACGLHSCPFWGPKSPHEPE